MGEKVRDARLDEWESVISSVKREIARLEKDVHDYEESIKNDSAKRNDENEKLLRQALLDHKTTLKILETLYQRQLPKTPSV